MSSTAKFSLIFYAGSLFMMIGVFAKPLGIPDPWDFLPLFLGILFIFLGLRLQKRVELEIKLAGKPLPVVPLEARRRRFWIIAATLVLSMAVIMPILPYIVDNFSLSNYYFMIPSDIIGIIFFLYFLHKKLVRDFIATDKAIGERQKIP